MRTRYLNLIVISTMALVACSAPVVGKSTSPNPDSGYVYGIFELPKPIKNCDWGADFILQSIDTTTEYRLAFSSREPIEVFPLRPGRYRITHVIAKNCLSRESDRKSYSSPLISGDIDVKPATATYIGNYAVQTYTGAAPNGAAITMVNLTRQCRDFTNTTHEFLKSYSAFAPVRTIDGTTGTAACIRPGQ